MIRSLVKIFSAVFVLLLIAVAGFLYTFNANDYRDEMIAIAEAVTGRNISIAGDLEVSLEYPWLGIRLEKISIDNPSGFGDNTFATIDRFDVSLKIIPLLLNRLDIGKLQLHRLKADLVRKASGENNWEGIVDESGFGYAGLSIGSIEMDNTNLSWSDLGADKHYRILKMSAVTRAVASGQPLPVEIKAFVESKEPEWQAGINIKSMLGFSQDTVIDAGDLKLVARYLLPDTDIGKGSLVMAADSKIDLESGLLELNNARLSTLGLDISGTLEIENLFTDPVIRGPIKVASFAAAALADQLKYDLPQFTNPDSLAKLSLTTLLKTDFKAFYLDDIVADVDGHRLTGHIHLSDPAKPAARFALQLDRLPLGDYLLAQNAPADKQTALAFERIRKADIAGTIDVDTVLLDDAEIRELHAEAQVSDGVFSTSQMTMLVDDNNVSASIRLDLKQTSQAVLVAEVNNADADIIVNPVLKVIGGEETPSVVGLVDVDVNLHAIGASWKALQQSARGTVKLDMDKLTVTGFDFDRAARKVVNDYGNRYDFRASKAFMSEFLADSITEFDGLHATLHIAQGKISNDDLKLVSDLVTVTGSGAIDFINHVVDYRPVIDMHIDNTANLRNKLRDHPMEYQVQGPFGDLTTAFDADRYDLLVGRMLIQETKERQYRRLNEQKKTNTKNAWSNVISTK